MPEKRPALGRGLSALIPDTAPVPQSESETHPSEVDLDLLQPNAEQPRTDMDEARLDELARSIKASGVIQPILVRPVSGGGYEIVAGERRWRAAQKAGLLRVPVDGVTGLRVAGASKVIPGVLAGMLAGGLGGFLLALVGARSSGRAGLDLELGIGVASAVGGSLVGSGVGALGGYMVSSSKTYRFGDEYWGVVVPEQPGGDG